MSNSDAPLVEEETLAERLNRVEAKLAQYEALLTGWPSAPTIAQGFLGHRWQRRDGADYPELQIPEAPFDPYYYGRHAGGWAQVVEEAPALTARRSDTGWARASFGSDVPWISLDDVLANYLPDDAPVDGFTYGRRNNFWQQLEQVFASTNSPQFLGTPTAPTAPPADNSLVLANTTFVNAAIAAAESGVPDVPNVNGAYARTASGPDGSVKAWVDFNALGVAPLASPVFTGSPTAPSPAPEASGPQLATAQFVSANYLPRAGGQMTGPLITQAGGSPTNLGVAIGDNSTGLYRPTNGVMVVSVGGAAVAQFMPVTVAFFVSANLGGNPINGLGDPSLSSDAVNLRSADARYLRPAVGGIVTGPLQVTTPPVIPNDATNKGYVDNAIGAVATPTTLRTQAFEPNQVVIPSPTANLLIFDQNVDVPAAGLRYLLVTVDPLFACDQPASNPWSLVYTCLLSPPGVEVPVLAFKIGNGTTDFLRSPVSFRVVIDASPGSIRVQVVVRTDTVNPPLTQLGANSTVASMRTVVTVTDLGPVGGSENAESENEPSGDGRGERTATRPDHRRHARTSARAR